MGSLDQATAEVRTETAGRGAPFFFSPERKKFFNFFIKLKDPTR